MNDRSKEPQGGVDEYGHTSILGDVAYNVYEGCTHVQLVP